MRFYYCCLFIIVRLNVEKLVKLGLNPGPLYGQLSRGYNITMSDGHVVCFYSQMFTKLFRSHHQVCYLINQVEK